MRTFCLMTRTSALTTMPAASSAKLLREKSLEPRARFPLTPYMEPQLTYSETLPSSPHMVLCPDERPQLHRLSVDTNLQHALIERPTHGHALSLAGQHSYASTAAAALPRELRSSSLTQCGDHVDFIAPAENMKQFFKLLQHEGAISIAVHRVGDSLVLEGLEAIPASEAAAHSSTNAGGDAEPPHGGRKEASTHEDGRAPAAAAPATGMLQLHHKSLHSRFLCYSMGAEQQDPQGSSAAKDVGDGEGALDDFDVDDDDDDDEREAWMPPRRPPRGFRRVVRWQLDELSLLLGSDTVVFRSDEQGRSCLDGSHSAAGYHAPSFSVGLHETNSEATSMVCLDYWLENVMSNASATALCLHKDGVVQGYRVVPTSELPSGCGIGSGFSPSAVTACAVSVLRFLRQHCTRDAGTYWLTRPTGSDELQLFDITDWPSEDHEGGANAAGRAEGAPHAAEADDGTKPTGAVPRGGADARLPPPAGDGSVGSSAAALPVEGESRDGGGGGSSDPDGSSSSSEGESSTDSNRGRRRPGPFAVPVALLCWRIAEQLTSPVDAPRRRRLLASCVSLLDDGHHTKQMPMAAAAYEAIADGHLHEAHSLLPLPSFPVDDWRGGGGGGGGGGGEHGRRRRRHHDR